MVAPLQPAFPPREGLPGPDRLQGAGLRAEGFLWRGQDRHWRLELLQEWGGGSEGRDEVQGPGS